MSIFSKLSASKKQVQRLQEEKKQIQKADGEPNPKYMHTPKHAYVDALTSTSGVLVDDNRQSLREAVERRKSRLSQPSSYSTINGLNSTHSSSSAMTTMSNWEARKALAHKKEFQKAATPVAITSPTKSYQSSPLASIAPSIPGPSSVSSCDHLEIASSSFQASSIPASLRPTLRKSRSSQKKFVTIQAPSGNSSPTSTTCEEPTEAPPISVIKPTYVPLTKTLSINTAEVLADSSSEEEKEVEQTAKKGKRRLALFWRKRSLPVMAIAA